MKTRPPATTVVLESHYHTPDAAVLAAFPVVLRAGHLRAAEDYAVERRCSPGHNLLFCVAGVGVVRVGGRDFSVGKGELAWINGYAPHAQRAVAAEPWELLWLRMDGPGVMALHRLLGAEANPVFGFEKPAAVRSCLRRVLRLMGGAALHREDGAHGMLAELTTLLRRSRRGVDGPACMSAEGERSAEGGQTLMSVIDGPLF